MRYKVVYFTREKTSLFGYEEIQHIEYCKTSKDLDIIKSIIAEDESIFRAFVEDVTNTRIEHIK